MSGQKYERLKKINKVKKLTPHSGGLVSLVTLILPSYLGT